MKIKREVKGAFAAQTIVSIILVLVGLILILLFIRQLGFTGRVDREACHASVITRATLPEALNSKGLVILKCQTRKICFTTGFIGGSCAEYKNANGVTNVKVDDLQDIERQIATEMVDCWTMLGQGKVSIFSNWRASNGLGEIYSSCVICSRFAFDRDNLKKKGINLENLDVQTYMMSHKVPNEDISYFEKLVGKSSIELKVEDIAKAGVPSFISEKNVITAKVDPNTPATSLGLTSEPNPQLTINTKGELSILFMQVSAPTYTGALKNLGQTALGVGVGSWALLGTKATWAVGKGAVNLIAANPIISLIVAATGAGIQGYEVVSNRNLAAGFCGDLEYGGEQRNGCSAVRTLDYNEDIRQYCNVVESIE